MLRLSPNHGTLLLPNEMNLLKKTMFAKYSLSSNGISNRPMPSASAVAISQGYDSDDSIHYLDTCEDIFAHHATDGSDRRRSLTECRKPSGQMWTVLAKFCNTSNVRLLVC